MSRVEKEHWEGHLPNLFRKDLHNQFTKLTRGSFAMSGVINFEAAAKQINAGKGASTGRQLAAGLIAPAKEEYEPHLAEERAAEPIKKLSDIERIVDYLTGQGRWRDNMMFVLGINFGLRISDLLRLRFCDLITENSQFKESFSILEMKTENTRRHKQNRHITINEAVIEAVTLYLEHTSNVSLSDYLFRSESGNGSNRNVPIHRNSADRILKGIARDLQLPYKVSTHSLRKTFALHQMLMSDNDPRKLLLLQKILGHSSTMQTLTYIGITNDEIAEAYRELNLGSKTRSYWVCKQFVEDVVTCC
jgi:integrase